MATIVVKDATGVDRTIEAPNTNGQATGANSAPVVPASDWTPNLATGASTSALQTTGNSSLADIVSNTGRLPVQGQAVAASSLPVVLASNQPAIPTTTPLAAPVVGQIKIAVTNTAVALPSNVLVNGIVIKAKSTNAVAGAFIGGAGVTTTDDGTGNGYKIVPGEAMSFAVPNSNAIYVNGTANDVFYYGGN
jgi:hypothetical protein